MKALCSVLFSGRSEYLDLLENMVPPSRKTLRRLPSKVDTIPNEDFMQCVVSGRSEYLDLLENIVPPSRTTLRRLPSKVDTIPNEGFMQCVVSGRSE